MPDPAPPQPAIAVLLALLLPPLGLQYAGARRLAFASAALLLCSAALALLWPAGVAALVLLMLGSAALAFVCARRWRSHHGRRRESPGNLMVTTAVLVILGWGLLRSVAFDVFRMPASSMEPTVAAGSLIFVDIRPRRRAQLLQLWPALPLPTTSPRPGELWLFQPDQTSPWLKRIIGVPGDRIDIEGEQVRVNGVELRQPASDPTAAEEQLGAHRYRVQHRPLALRRPLLAVRLAADEFWVMGDNRDNSQDSRHFGAIQRVALRGRVVSVWSI